MRPIIEQPRGDDDLMTPEFIIFLCGALPVIGALYSFIVGLSFAAELGCLDGDCTKSDPEGLGLLMMMVAWGVPQAVLTMAAIAGYLYLILAKPTHRTAIAFASAGLAATAVGVGITLAAIIIGR